MTMMLAEAEDGAYTAVPEYEACTWSVPTGRPASVHPEVAPAV
jgi:hypothetical protein